MLIFMRTRMPRFVLLCSCESIPVALLSSETCPETRALAFRRHCQRTMWLTSKCCNFLRFPPGIPFLSAADFNSCSVLQLLRLPCLRALSDLDKMDESWG
jgi:hypothetical protein